MLQAMVRGSTTLLMPYVKQIFESVLKLLEDPSVAIFGAALSTIGELAVASPETIREHLVPTDHLICLCR